MRMGGWLMAGALAACVVAPAGTAGAVAVVVSHAPRLGAEPPEAGKGGSATSSSLGWASSNWSGYAVTGSAFTRVTGSWTVPAVGASSGNTYSSSWVGIDGFNNSHLIQTGTDQDFVNGRARYAAWWEILPAPETAIASITVSPGDNMTASITSGTTWTVAITDTTTGASFTTRQAYSGPGTSAEWIEEAPTVGGRIATLAHYGTTVFDPGTVNGVAPGLVAADGGVMVQRRSQVSTPSAPDGDADGFAAGYGSVTPAPPGS
jgi:peptidase A4-like protein